MIKKACELVSSPCDPFSIIIVSCAVEAEATDCGLQTEYPREVWPVTPKLGEDGG